MTTIEQIISAFDIADTDGDGCLNWNEAREAVEALWIDPSSILTGKAGQPEDEMTESTGPVNFDFLWYDSTTLQSPDHLGLVFTLDEFRLVCSQMIAPPSHTSPSSIEIPTVCLKRSLESLLSSAFVTLKTEIVGYLGRSYQSALVDLFPVHSFSAESSLTETFISNPPFRAKWKQRLAALESDSEAGDLTEKVTIPCHPTIAVSSLLRYTATFLHRTSLSIDTVHKTDGSILIPQHFHITSTDQLVTVSSLWDYTRSIFYASCRQMIEEELNSQHQLLTRLANSSAKFQQVFEDYSLQLLFDMQILHSCFSTNTSGVPSSSSPVGSFPCYDLYYNSIDPVNIAFLEPFLVEECQGYLSKYHLLLPGADQRTVLNQQLLENVGKSLSGLSSGQVKGKHDARSEELLTSIFVTTGEPSSVTKKGNSESSTR